MMSTLVLADLDGTLLAPNGSIWPESREIARIAEDRGYVLGLCSARPTWSVMAVAKQLGSVVKYIASFQGAIVVQRTNQIDIDWQDPGACRSQWETLRKCFLEESVSYTVERLIPYGESLWWYSEKDWWIRSADVAAMAESRVLQVPWTGIGLPQIRDHLVKILTVCPMCTDVVLEELERAQLPIRYSASQRDYIEIVSKEVDSDKGARLIRNHFESAVSSRAKVLSIGDSLNDLGMLMESDIAITFADSQPALRAAADLVLCADRRLALERFRELLLQAS